MLHSEPDIKGVGAVLLPTGNFFPNWQHVHHRFFCRNSKANLLKRFTERTDSVLNVHSQKVLSECMILDFVCYHFMLIIADIVTGQNLQLTPGIDLNTSPWGSDKRSHCFF
jgi:hypothetical protein